MKPDDIVGKFVQTSTLLYTVSANNKSKYHKPGEKNIHKAGSFFYVISFTRDSDFIELSLIDENLSLRKMPYLGERNYFIKNHEFQIIA